MAIGKTSPSISVAEIFNYFSEAEVLASVFPEVRALPCLISSPFRKDVHPSFRIYLTDGNHVRFKDFSTGENGGLFDLLCKLWNCTFRQALQKLASFLIDKKNIIIKPRSIKTFTRKETDELTSIQVVVRPWRDYDYEYWASYGIEKKWLHYAEIYPISYKIVTKKESPEDKGRKFDFKADKYAYCWVNRKEGKLSIKVYQPFNTKGYKWCSKQDASVIDLWTKVPEYGDRIIIASSMKDALCLSCNLHIPAIALQGEGFTMSDTAINELKRRYKRIFISFDTDTPGIKDAVKLSEKTGFINIVPDLKECKDYSDAFKKYGKEWFVKTLTPLFN